MRWMKKIIIFFPLFVFISASAYAAEVDPMWRLQRTLSGPSFSISDMIDADQAAPGEEEALIEVFVKTSDTTLTAERIRNCGGKVRTITKTIITASLPAFVLEGEAAGWTEAEYIEAAKPMSPNNNLADIDTEVTVAQAGTGLPYGYDGTGVIIGIIDSGIDLTHPAFKSESGDTRVLYLWDQNDGTGTGPTEIESTYGTEYTQSQIDAGTVSEEDTVGHGTHVAGTAGGRDSSYSGVAPKASFIIVGNSSYSGTTEVDAAYYIFQKAAALGMPAVINISLGSNLGAHDGTSVEEQALDELVDASSGRVIVAAAGNEGSTSYTYDDTTYNGYSHINYAVTNMDGTYFRIYSKAEVVDAVVDIWGPQVCDVSISLGLWDSSGLVNSTGWISSGNTDSGILSSYVEYAIDRTETTNSQNNKWHSYLGIDVGDDYNVESNYFDIVFRLESGTCDSFDAWPDDTTYFTDDSTVISGVQYHSGDNDKTVNTPSTAANVISVGAHATRENWTDSSGAEVIDPANCINQVDDIATFSSRGPAVDPTAQGTKPNITAPGAYLISARSSQASFDEEYIIDDYHVAMPGTSMSSPHVAGIVALMLQAYPSLTYSEIIESLQDTARSDAYVGAVPNDDWGYGKADALAALTAVTTDYPPTDDSKLIVAGVTGGYMNTDYTTQEIVVDFPRAVKESSLSSSNLYVTMMTTTSASLSQSTAWTPSPCDPGDIISSTVALDGTQTATITLDQPIGLADFAVCVSPNIKDTDNTTFWGKTVQFGTSLPNTGCSLTRSANNDSFYPIVMLLVLVGTVLLIRRS